MCNRILQFAALVTWHKLKRMRILIADDNDLVRGAIRNLLSTEPNCEVCGEAANGAQALERTRALAPELILLDISMPGASGFEVARALRHENPQIKILIMSQEDAVKLAPTALEAGADGCVDKARLARDLVETIRKFELREISDAAGN